MTTKQENFIEKLFMILLDIVLLEYRRLQMIFTKLIKQLKRVLRGKQDLLKHGICWGLKKR